MSNLLKHTCHQLKLLRNNNGLGCFGFGFALHDEAPVPETAPCMLVPSHASCYSLNQAAFTPIAQPVDNASKFNGHTGCDWGASFWVRWGSSKVSSATSNWSWHGRQQLALCSKQLPPPKELMYVFVINFLICTYYSDWSSHI
jgi:hypothetical protein